MRCARLCREQSRAWIAKHERRGVEADGLLAMARAVRAIAHVTDQVLGFTWQLAFSETVDVLWDLERDGTTVNVFWLESIERAGGRGPVEVLEHLARVDARVVTRFGSPLHFETLRAAMGEGARCDCWASNPDILRCCRFRRPPCTCAGGTLIKYLQRHDRITNKTPFTNSEAHGDWGTFTTRVAELFSSEEGAL